MPRQLHGPAASGAPSRRVLVVYGTRPEAVKLAPVVAELATTRSLAPYVVVTGQHREMLDQVNRVFGIEPDADLDIHAPGQSLVDVTTRTLRGVSEVVREVNPDAVVVQGDTTTAFAAALAAFYEQVPVAHVEAGLRTDDRYAPFPEELNRRLASRLANLHLAPTPSGRDNLQSEAVAPAEIAVTGNTVLDALATVVARHQAYSDPRVAAVAASGRRLVVLTTHRRESWGEPMRGVARAVAEVARSRPDIEVVAPLHRNPLVRAAVEPELAPLPNATLTEPMAYGEFARLLADATLVLTDSGGIQEEAPSLGKPVLVLRATTERPEAVAAGTVRLVGTDPGRVREELGRLLDDDGAYAEMAKAVNPYGDGYAAPRCVAAIAELLGVGTRLPDFDPAADGHAGT